MEAPVSFYPSYIWGSILYGREVLLHESRWQIGDSNSVCIWTDPWIPQPSSFHVITSPCLFPVDAKVSSLINQGTHSWNWPVAEAILHPIDIERLQLIPLGAFSLPDHFDLAL